MKIGNTCKAVLLCMYYERNWMHSHPRPSLWGEDENAVIKTRRWRMHKHGFTLIELVMVIVILGILAVVAVPKFLDLRTSAKESASDGVVSAGNAGAQIWKAQYLIDSTTYTTTYPSEANSACCLDNDTVPTITGVTFTYDATNGTWTYSTT